jgi:hypothetical protein
VFTPVLLKVNPSCRGFWRPAAVVPVLLKMMPSCSKYCFPAKQGGNIYQQDGINHQQGGNIYPQGSPILQQDGLTRSREAFFCSREPIF